MFDFTTTSHFLQHFDHEGLLQVIQDWRHNSQNRPTWMWYG